MIHVANGGTAAGVSDWIRCQQRPPRRGDGGPIGLEHRRREEPPHHHLRDAGHAGIEHRAPARLHRVRIGDARRRIGEDDVSEAAGGVDGQPLPDHAAERQAAEREARQAAGVGDREDVVRQRLNRVVATGDRRRAVAAGVVAQDAEVRQQIGGLRVPHAVVEAERMRQHDRRPVVLAIEAIVGPAIVVFEEWHGSGLRTEGVAAAPRRRRDRRSDRRSSAVPAATVQRRRRADPPAPA